MQSNTAWVNHLGGRVEYVQGDRYRTRCMVAGDGSKLPLLLLHGIGGHLETFVRNVRPLSVRMPDRTVYAIDFIGHGFSDAPLDVEYSEAAYIEQVEDVLRALGHDRAHIFGESLGGLVATRMGLDRPDLLGTVGQITPAGLGNLESDSIPEDVQQESESGTSDLFTRTKEMLDSGVTRETVRHRLSWLFVNEPDEELVDIRHRIYQRPEIQEVMLQLYDAPRQYYTNEELESLDVPTLLVHTEHNPSSKKEQAEVAHGLMPRSEYHLLEHSGHWPQYEQPDEFNDIVIDFLSGRE